MSSSLSRQSLALLGIVLCARRVYGKTKLQKLAFLLQKESRSREFKDLFDFSPYYYGPFAPEIYSEIEFLVAQRLVSAVEKSLERGGQVVPTLDYVLTPEGERAARAFVESLPPDAGAELRAIVTRFNFQSLANILEYTYKTYPEMASRSMWQPE